MTLRTRNCRCRCRYFTLLYLAAVTTNDSILVAMMTEMLAVDFIISRRTQEERFVNKSDSELRVDICNVIAHDDTSYMMLHLSKE